MTLIVAGMTPADRGMSMPGWHVMDLASPPPARTNHQGGPSGGRRRIEVRELGWNT